MTTTSAVARRSLPLGSFNSGIMTVGGEFSMAFEAAGAFDYFCAIHPEMSGTVTVGAATP